MKVPFTWKVTGWFMIGWSAEFPPGEVRPLRYFGEDLVAYRGESGDLHLLQAHCRHLGAHIGHGGKVVGDCVECPFHGWRWDPDGGNRYIPPGSDGATLLPELGPEPTDIVLTRWHGVGPMGGTDLDPILRNLGVSTIIAVGVSLNVAIPTSSWTPSMPDTNHGIIEAQGQEAMCAGRVVRSAPSSDAN